jgi:hypothetical protein
VEIAALACPHPVEQMIFQRSIKPDRRRRKRQLLNTSVQVFTESAHVDALGINLSEVGVCLFAMVNLSVGSQIQVEFLPPRSTELVRVSGIVRHRALYLYGIEFLVVSEQPSTAELLQAVENWRPVRVEKRLDRETRQSLTVLHFWVISRVHIVANDNGQVVVLFC